MNYSTAPDYHNNFTHIMSMREEDFWVHSPQFRKILGLTIGELFKTKITMFSSQNNMGNSYAMTFVDSHLNRWGVSILSSDVDSEGPKFSIGARFPISVTKVMHYTKMTEKEISDPAFNKSDIAICVHDTSSWYAGGEPCDTAGPTH